MMGFGGGGGSSGPGGATGSTDNAVLRADGTGGSTMQGSSLVVDDNGAVLFNGSTDHAIFKSGNYLTLGPTNNAFLSVYYDYIGISAAQVVGWTSGGSNNGSIDAGMTRVGAGSIRIGKTPGASPSSYTVTVGEDSRSGTDSNVAGANGTIQSGNGTGNAAGASLIFKTPVPTTSGTGAQTQTEGLRVTNGAIKTPAYTVANLPAAATVGAAGRSFVTDANATTFNSIVAGGGSNGVPVFSDGTNWRIG